MLSIDFPFSLKMAKHVLYPHLVDKGTSYQLERVTIFSARWSSRGDASSQRGVLKRANV